MLVGEGSCGGEEEKKPKGLHLVVGLSATAVGSPGGVAALASLPSGIVCI